MNAKVTFRAPDKNALAAHGFIVRTQQKVNLLAGLCEFGAIEASNGAAANNRDFQDRTDWPDE